MKAMLFIFALLVGALFLWLVAPAHAASMCGLRVDFIKALNDRYQESRKAIGISGQVNLVEVFTSKSGTWTILYTTPNKRTCIIAAGNAWEDLPIEIEEKNL